MHDVLEIPESEGLKKGPLQGCLAEIEESQFIEYRYRWIKCFRKGLENFVCYAKALQMDEFHGNTFELKIIHFYCHNALIKVCLLLYLVVCLHATEISRLGRKQQTPKGMLLSMWAGEESTYSLIHVFETSILPFHLPL